MMLTSRYSGLTFAQRIERTVGQILLYGSLTLAALGAFFPVYWMAVLGTLNKDQVMSLPPHFLPGSDLMINLNELFQRIPYVRNYTNSLMVATSQTALVLFFCSLAGYAFSKRQFPAKNFLFLFMLGTMFIPAWAGIVPWFLIIKALGLMDKLYAMVITGAVSAFGVFWMRQAVSQAIPDEIIDAARIDGCSAYGMYFRIVLPIIRPAMGALAIMTFMGSWNNFLGPLIILQSTENFTLPITLRTLLGTTGTRPTPWGALMAGTALAILPIIIIFAFSSKQFISGLTAGALKA
jgi:ABC-type glycerol-3-phosphate transport system permease component